MPGNKCVNVKKHYFKPSKAKDLSKLRFVEPTGTIFNFSFLITGYTVVFVPHQIPVDVEDEKISWIIKIGLRIMQCREIYLLKLIKYSLTLNPYLILDAIYSMCKVETWN